MPLPAESRPGWPVAPRELTAAQAERLRTAESLWLATVKPNSTAHLVPVWAVLYAGRLYVGTERNSQKVLNVASHGSAVLALPDPYDVLIVEGRAIVAETVEDGVLDAFRTKYGWEFTPGKQTIVVEVTPTKILSWQA